MLATTGTMRGLRRFASRGTGTIGFTMVTRVRGDRIQLIHQWRVVFDADLLKQPFTTVYRSVLSKQGTVGFRCYPDEEATITRVVVREPAVTLTNACSRRRRVLGGRNAQHWS